MTWLKQPEPNWILGDRFMGYIYQIRNTNNDKVYIGSTRSLEQRKLKHFSTLKKNRHSNPYLQNAYNQFPDAFRFEILLEVDDKKLLQQEADEISNYVVNGQIDNERCYNFIINPTNPVFSHTPEAIEKIRQAGTGRVFSLESREKMRQSQLGIKRSPETRAKISQSKLNPSIETREKLRQSRLGKKLSLETIEKIRQASLNNGNARKLK